MRLEGRPAGGRSRRTEPPEGVLVRLNHADGSTRCGVDRTPRRFDGELACG